MPPTAFSAFNLSAPLLRAIEEKGYTAPTPVQTEAIPAILAGRDVMAAAQTGTGKTAGFTLPLLQRLTTGAKVRGNHIRALILTPTRELAMQVAESVAGYGRHLPLKSAVVYGGVKINPQMMRLRGGVDVLVATPGRLLDLFGQNAVKFTQVEILVLDEADRMLDLGFSVEIAKILALLPKKRQNLLFSATFSSDIRALTGKLLKNPVRIEASPRNSAAQGVRQYIYEVDKGKKSRLLCHLLRNKGQGQALVFVRTREGADRLTRELHRAQIEAAAIHGDKSQGQRTATLDDFKGGAIQVLVATDVAARGIDIHDLPLVVNLDLPKVAEDYIHRIGRTGRAGLQGEAISLVSADEAPLLANIEALLRKLLPREIETGFVPTHPVPLTQLTKTKAKKPKKPKQKPAAQQRTGETFPRDGKTRPGEEAKAAGRRQPPRGRDRQPRKSAAPKTNRGGRNN